MPATVTTPNGKQYKAQLESLAREPGFEDEKYQVTIEEVARKDLSNLQGEGLTESFIMPTQFGPDSVLSDVKTISAMKGNAANGKTAAARLYYLPQDRRGGGILRAAINQLGAGS